MAAPDGRLFVASDLARVHVYDAQGRPLRGFEVPARRFALRVAGPDRLLVLPEQGEPLAYDFAGQPAPPPSDAELAAVGTEGTDTTETTETTPRIESGDVVRAGPEGESLRVRGYTSQWTMLLHTLAVGACLFSGGLLLVGGVVATGRRATP